MNYPEGEIPIPNANNVPMSRRRLNGETIGFSRQDLEDLYYGNVWGAAVRDGTAPAISFVSADMIHILMNCGPATQGEIPKYRSDDLERVTIEQLQRELNNVRNFWFSKRPDTPTLAALNDELWTTVEKMMKQPRPNTRRVVTRRVEKDTYADDD